MLYGNDPLPMYIPSFVVKSLLSGRALGIMGALALGDQTKYGNGPLDTMEGSLYSLGEDIFDATWAYSNPFAWCPHL